MTGNRALELARIIFEAEPDAALGDPEAVERVAQALAKVTGAILAPILLRHGEDALADTMRSVAKTVEQEARHTASMMVALQHDTGDPPGTIN